MYSMTCCRISRRETSRSLGRVGIMYISFWKSSSMVSISSAFSMDLRDFCIIPWHVDTLRGEMGRGLHRGVTMAFMLASKTGIWDHSAEISNVKSKGFLQDNQTTAKKQGKTSSLRNLHINEGTTDLPKMFPSGLYTDARVVQWQRVSYTYWIQPRPFCGLCSHDQLHQFRQALKAMPRLNAGLQVSTFILAFAN